MSTTTETLRVVLGDRRYAVDHDWARLPAGETLAALSTVAVDSRGRVYAFRRRQPPVMVFDADGGFVAAWGAGRIADAHGITVTADDRVFLVDRDAHEIVEYTLDGDEAATLGERNRPRMGAPFNHPTAIAVAPNGQMYVTDGYGNAQVHRFDAAGALINSWGGPGAGPGLFSTPHAVAVDAKGRILVADRENHRVQLFEPDGTFIAAWSGMVNPMAVAVDAEGRVLVSDQTPSLILLSPEGEWLGRCKPVAQGGHGIALNAAGDIFLSEMTPPRITKLSVIS